MIPPRRLAFSLAFLAVGICCLSYSVLLLSESTIAKIAYREALLEDIGAILFLCSSILSLTIFLSVRRHSPDRRWKSGIVFLLLATFFLVAFGEEVSWGTLGLSKQARQQRFSLNAQREFNIHNLHIFDEYGATGERKSGIRRLFTANRLFDYFMLCSFLILPVVSERRPLFRRLLDSIGIPVLPWIFSLALLANLTLTLLAEVTLADGEFIHGAISEIREFNYSVLCSLGLVFLLIQSHVGLSPAITRKSP